jgi:hypothetical protein
MAEDVIVLLDFLGWTAKRDLHVVGISLGGMISQGIPIPERPPAVSENSVNMQNWQLVSPKELYP